jgi:phage gpG-like protein
VSLSLANADLLFGNNPSYAAFPNLGGASGTGHSTDYFDLGLPFFFGRTVYVGIGGKTVPNSVSAPYGYFAF